MQFQSGELLSEWVRNELSYFQSIGQITSASYDNNQWSEQWTYLIDNGFVYRLFDQIDAGFFHDTLNSKHQDGSTKRETLLRQYWLELDKYMNIKQAKRIDPSYLSKQTTLKKQLTSREYSRTSISSLEMSIIELVKLQFYLLVQKHNSTNMQQNMDEGEICQKEHQLMDETLACSVIVRSDGDQSLRGSFNHEADMSLSGEKQLKLTDVDNSGYVGSLSVSIERNNQNGEDNQNEYKEESMFLQRICELPQEVQEYLVTVVESIEQRQLIQQLVLPIGTETPLTHSFLYMQQQSQTNSPSEQNFKKIIYRQIEQVSEQNEELKQKMELIIEENLKLEKQLEDNQQQENQLLTKINNYNYEKQELFDYFKYQHSLNINSLEDFIEIVQHVHHQNQLLQNTIAEIQQRNYLIQTQNAQKIHSINKNALEITQTNDHITIVKSKITDLKQDIQYLDQFINGNPNIINAQLIHSIHLDDLSNDDFPLEQQQSQSFTFNKSIDLQARHSFGHVLRENLDIYNQKLTSKTNAKPTHNRILTDSITGYTTNRSSLHNSQKTSTHKKNHKSSFPPKDQQNINPTPFQQDELLFQNFLHCDSKSRSHISINYELREEEREIQQEKEKYKQDLVNSLQLLYKQINDLTKEVTQAKEENKMLEKRNNHNEKKINQLKSLHDAFLKQAKRA